MKLTTNQKRHARQKAQRKHKEWLDRHCGIDGTEPDVLALDAQRRARLLTLQLQAGTITRDVWQWELGKMYKGVHYEYWQAESHRLGVADDSREAWIERQLRPHLDNDLRVLATIRRRLDRGAGKADYSGLLSELDHLPRLHFRL